MEGLGGGGEMKSPLFVILVQLVEIKSGDKNSNDKYQFKVCSDLPSDNSLNNLTQSHPNACNGQVRLKQISK